MEYSHDEQTGIQSGTAMSSEMVCLMLNNLIKEFKTTQSNSVEDSSTLPRLMVVLERCDGRGSGSILGSISDVMEDQKNLSNLIRIKEACNSEIKVELGKEDFEIENVPLVKCQELFPNPAVSLAKTENSVMHDVTFAMWKFKKEEVDIEQDKSEINETRCQELFLNHTRSIVTAENGVTQDMNYDMWKIKNEEVDVKEEETEIHETRPQHLNDRCRPRSYGVRLRDTIYQDYKFRSCSQFKTSNRTPSRNIIASCLDGAPQQRAATSPRTAQHHPVPILVGFLPSHQRKCDGLWFVVFLQVRTVIALFPLLANTKTKLGTELCLSQYCEMMFAARFCCEQGREVDFLSMMQVFEMSPLKSFTDLNTAQSLATSRDKLTLKSNIVNNCKLKAKAEYKPSKVSQLKSVDVFTSKAESLPNLQHSRMLNIKHFTVPSVYRRQLYEAVRQVFTKKLFDNLFDI